MRTLLGSFAFTPVPLLPQPPGVLVPPSLFRERIGFQCWLMTCPRSGAEVEPQPTLLSAFASHMLKFSTNWLLALPFHPHPPAVLLKSSFHVCFLWLLLVLHSSHSSIRFREEERVLGMPGCPGVYHGRVLFTIPPSFVNSIFTSSKPSKRSPSGIAHVSQRMLVCLATTENLLVRLTYPG